MTAVEKPVSLKALQAAKAPRKERKDEASVAYYGPLSLAAAVIVWEVLVRWTEVPELYLPAPSVILVKLYSLFVDGGIARDLGLTLMRIFAGFGAAAVVGIFVGVLMGTSKKIYAIGDAFVSVVYPIPKISLLPLLVIWLGSGNLFQIVLAALGCFFPIVVNTVLGVRQCDPGLILAARDLGATENQIKWKVIVRQRFQASSAVSSWLSASRSSWWFRPRCSADKRAWVAACRHRARYWRPARSSPSSCCSPSSAGR